MKVIKKTHQFKRNRPTPAYTAFKVLKQTSYFLLNYFPYWKCGFKILENLRNKIHKLIKPKLHPTWLKPTENKFHLPFSTNQQCFSAHKINEKRLIH